MTRVAIAVFMILAAHGQAVAADPLTLGSPRQVRVLDVELYRGLIRLQADPLARSVTIRPGIVGWDGWVRGTDPWPHRRDLAPDAFVADMRGDTVRFEAPTLRDLVALEIVAPPHTEIRIRISHYGDVSVSNMTGPIEVDQFQGTIDLAQVPGPVLAHITRDGDIHVRLAKSPARRPMAVTTYEGNITLDVPAAVAPRLSITTVEGAIRNELAPSGPIAEPRIMIRNARGTIHVRPL